MTLDQNEVGSRDVFVWTPQTKVQIRSQTSAQRQPSPGAALVDEAGSLMGEAPRVAMMGIMGPRSRLGFSRLDPDQPFRDSLRSMNRVEPLHDRS